MAKEKKVSPAPAPQQQPQAQHKILAVPHFSWPTSKPGPQATPPPPGLQRMPGRTEQTVEVGYNQETGHPSVDSPARVLPDAKLTGATSFDQPTVQQAEKRRKKK